MSFVIDPRDRHLTLELLEILPHFHRSVATPLPANGNARCREIIKNAADISIRLLLRKRHQCAMSDERFVL
jgi:hypothetical protein